MRDSELVRYLGQSALRVKGVEPNHAVHARVANHNNNQFPVPRNVGNSEL